MSIPTDQLDLYGAYYFKHGCGRPYERTPDWLKFFAGMAETITHLIAPRTVLDAGCAMGFLVEGLRERGLEAFGIDISTYAIQQVHPKIKPYCRVGSVLDPLPQRYDLIVSIEVLEHLPKPESEQAIANLCGASDDILFSSTPLDYREATHFNVQPPEYWANQFARHGFVRDVDFDASFITPWAVRFRRSQEPWPRLAQNYERRFWSLWKENLDLRNQLVIKEQTLAAKEQQIQALDDSLHEVTSHPVWKLLERAPWLTQNLIRLALSCAKALSHLGLSRPRETYGTWIVANEPSPTEIAEQVKVVQLFSYRPRISILVSIFNPALQTWGRLIKSILNQTYDEWELCLGISSSDDSPQLKTLIELSKKDNRIRFQALDNPADLSTYLQVVLPKTTGEFILYPGQTERLAPNLLYEIVKLLNTQRNIDLIYWDEDKLSANGIRQEPWFKPDWSPELLLSVNYLIPAVIRRSLLESVKVASGVEGALEWNISFQCIEQTQRIHHLPKILSHRPLARNWSAANPLAQLQSVEAHLRRLNVEHPQATFSKRTGCVRVLWRTQQLKVSIIIPSKNKVKFLRKCLESLFALTTYPNFEVIVVDNQSTDEQTLGYYATLRGHPSLHLVNYPAPFNFSVANNLGARYATGELLLFLNNDTEIIEPDWLEELVRWAERPEIGVVGTKLLYPNRTIQHAGVIMGMEGHCSHVFWGVPEEGSTGPFGSVEWYRNYMAVTGACLMMRREVFDQVGGFDEDYHLVFSDVEICLRVGSLGYRVVYTPFARLRHYEGQSRGDQIPDSDLHRGYLHMHSLVMAGDPYFNPNLSYSVRRPTLVQRGEENRMDRLRRLTRTP